MKYLSDEPTYQDQLQHAQLVKEIGERLVNVDPPFVVAVHGDWGSGKTSFLKKLRLFIAAESDFPLDEQVNKLGKDLWPDSFQGTNGDHKCTTVWFDAWKYQFEENPIVALLNEIRSRLTFFAKGKAKSSKLFYAGLMSLDKLTEGLGFSVSKIQEAGETWEKRNLHTPLDSELTKVLLSHAIEQIIGDEQKLVVFIDDLDRCQSAVAFKLLEVLKIYFSIPNCVFVLGLDWRNTRRGVAAALNMQLNGEKGGNFDHLANEYMEKICQAVVRLPLVANDEAYLTELLITSDTDDAPDWANIISMKKLVLRNPRKIKMFVNELNAYLGDNRPYVTENRMLILIIVWMRAFAHDLFAILQSDVDFWPEIVSYVNGKGSEVAALNAYLLPFAYLEDEVRSSFLHPSTEGVFWAANAIKAWTDSAKRDTLTDNEFKDFILK